MTSPQFLLDLLPALARFDSAFVLSAMATVLLAYCVFGATGFGSGAMSIPMLAHFQPLSFVVPLIALFDLAASAWTGWRHWPLVPKKELLALWPFMLVGMLLGTTVLLHVPANVMLFALAIFIIAYGLYNLLVRLGGIHWTKWQARWLIGLGGVFSTAFGSGGPFYLMVYMGRIPNVSQLRATTAVTIGFAVSFRLLTYLFSGLLVQSGLLSLALVLAPCALAGLVIGSRLHTRLHRDTVLRLVSIVLILNGVSLLWRLASHR
jgi:uncharacterized protein